MRVLSIKEASNPDDEGDEIVRVTLPDHHDANKVTIAVLKAIESLPKPRAPRSDKGKPKPKRPAAVTSDGMPANIG